MKCTHRLGGGTLQCTRDEHDEGGGHVYYSTWAADAHDRSEPNDDNKEGS